MMNDYDYFIPEEKQERQLLNDEAYKNKMGYNQNEESNINDETQQDSYYSSYLQHNDESMNMNPDQISTFIKTEKTKKNKTTVKKEKKKKAKCL